MNVTAENIKVFVIVKSFVIVVGSRSREKSKARKDGAHNSCCPSVYMVFKIYP